MGPKLKQTKITLIVFFCSIFVSEFFFNCNSFRLNMPPKLTHSQCCAIVCFVCGNESGKKGNSKINSTEVQLIRDHVMPGYDPHDERFV